jgi:hypothetical protein
MLWTNHKAVAIQGFAMMNWVLHSNWLASYDPRYVMILMSQSAMPIAHAIYSSNYENHPSLATLLLNHHEGCSFSCGNRRLRGESCALSDKAIVLPSSRNAMRRLVMPLTQDNLWSRTERHTHLNTANGVWNRAPLYWMACWCCTILSLLWCKSSLVWRLWVN